jgi:hypothetical protein
VKLAPIACILLIAFAALAQDNAEIVSKVEAVKYAPLPRMARIQGDVRLHLGPKGVELISGHPLLVPAATQSLTDLGNLSETEVDVIYHFGLVDPTVQIISKTVQRGDAFDRLILRALRIKAEKTVREPECVETAAPKNRIDLTKNPVEIWIYGSVPCLTTQASYIALR